MLDSYLTSYYDDPIPPFGLFQAMNGGFSIPGMPFMPMQMPMQMPMMPYTGGSGMIPSTNYDDIFKQAAAATGLPVEYIKATARAESDFRMLPPNHAGATGVMQMLPGTFNEVKAKYGKQYPLTHINDPYSNIMSGALYLNDQYKRFGSYELASAAYNAGPGRVLQYKGIPPFKETQNYVPRVMRFMRGE